MFIWWSSFYKQLKAARILQVAGAMGTGKTLLAVAIADKLLKDGYVSRVCSNFPVDVAGELSYRNSVALFDEAGTVFDSRQAFRDKSLNALSAELTFALRKAGSYFVVPSFLDVDKRFRVGVRVWRTHASSWLWRYAWQLGPEEPEEQQPGLNYWAGALWLLRPARYWGRYDTYFVPGRNLSIAFLQGWLAARSGYVPEDDEVLALFRSWGMAV